MAASTAKSPPWQAIEFHKNKYDSNVNTSFFGTVLGEWKHEPRDDEKALYALRERIEEFDNTKVLSAPKNGLKVHSEEFDTAGAVSAPKKRHASEEFASPKGCLLQGRSATEEFDTAGAIARKHSDESTAATAESDGKWEDYKKMVNPYEFVYTQPKYKDFPTSVCLINPLSRSYFKILEILSVSRFFELTAGERLRSAHVCEGPGGFIEGFYDECERRRLTPISATAMTLRPTQSNVPGWKRAATFLKKYSSVQILYGADNTGNILKYENQDAFITACPKVLLFTGDGGFDFSTDYSMQEAAVFPLLVASVRMGFECMRQGAVFVLKFFDIHHAATADLLCFLAAHFRSWSIYKPATSRPCNPEQYFIGVDYRGCAAGGLELLREWSRAACEGKTLARLITGEMPAEFAATLEAIRTRIVRSQIDYLERVFGLIGCGASDSKTVIPDLKVAEVMSYDWCHTFSVPVHPDRARAIEASRSDLLAAGRL